tara:strand:+ start:3478 stop:4395 length:918 start_codon:yes stop_codon:yes gene_type:complete
MPLILTQNEVTVNDAHDWNDIEGEQYHYPTKYRNKIIEGERFVYYHGVNRADGKKGEALYFGTGRIGSIWQDPDPERQKGGKIAWFCTIEDFERFPKPVPAKVDGVNREQGPQNLFRDGVRVTDVATFESILQASGIARNPGPSDCDLPAPEIVKAKQASNLLLPSKGTQKSGGGSVGRFARNAKAIGDWGEKLALKLLGEIDGSSNHVHRAAIGETPGWDLDYVRADGKIHRVEVKSTQAAAFRNIEITANEMAAAKQYGNDYSLFLIAKCMSEAPSYQIIPNPFGHIENSDWDVEPTVFRVSF